MIEIRPVYDPISGEPMPNVKQLRLGKQYMQINTSWATEIERLQRRSDALEIAEKALLDIKLSTQQQYIDEMADRALTAIAATTAQAGEEK
jgi:hypothetical protein